MAESDRLPDCTKCDNDTGGKFCPGCGRAISCSECKSFVQRDSNFCTNCGYPIKKQKSSTDTKELDVVSKPSVNKSVNITGAVTNAITGDHNQGDVTAYVNTPNPEVTGKTKLKKWTENTDASLQKTVDDTTEIKFHEMIVDLAKSVGCIWSPVSTGTAFRVGSDYIMTCFHVIEGIKLKLQLKSAGKIEDILRNKDVWVQFNYKPGDENNPEKELRFHFAAIVYSNPELDVAIVQLDAKSEVLPSPIRRFGPVGDNDRLHFIGHDRGWTKKLDPDCRVLSPSREEVAQRSQDLIKMGYQNCYAGMENRKRIYFQCGFQKGASGSPGADRRGDVMTVVTMLARGYPGFYYGLQEREQRSVNLGNDFFIEEGIDILAVLNAIEKDSRDVYKDLGRL